MFSVSQPVFFFCIFNIPLHVHLHIAWLERFYPISIAQNSTGSSLSATSSQPRSDSIRSEARLDSLALGPRRSHGYLWSWSGAQPCTLLKSSLRRPWFWSLSPRCLVQELPRCSGLWACIHPDLVNLVQSTWISPKSFIHIPGSWLFWPFIATTTTTTSCWLLSVEQQRSWSHSLSSFRDNCSIEKKAKKADEDKRLLAKKAREDHVRAMRKLKTESQIIGGFVMSLNNGRNKPVPGGK